MQAKVEALALETGQYIEDAVISEEVVQ